MGRGVQSRPQEGDRDGDGGAERREPRRQARPSTQKQRPTSTRPREDDRRKRRRNAPTGRRAPNWEPRAQEDRLKGGSEGEEAPERGTVRRTQPKEGHRGDGERGGIALL